MTANPILVIREATKSVPAVRYALGIAAIAAAASLVATFTGGYERASVIIMGLLFVGMVLLFVFSVLVRADSTAVRLAAVVLLWSSTAFFVLFLGFTATAAATGWPCNWADFLSFRSSCVPTQGKTIRFDTPDVIVGGRTATYSNPYEKILPQDACIKKVIAHVDDAVGNVAHAALELYLNNYSPDNLIQRHDVPDIPGDITFVVEAVGRKLLFASKQRNNYPGDEETRFHWIEVHYINASAC